ncbi:MAG: hypothetical protein ACOX8Q_02440 [Christensenellales bacterium]|jgi:hypothetical protein
MENYPYIPFVPDKKTVMRRMGAHNAGFPLGLEREIDQYLIKARSAFAAMGRADMYDIRYIGSDSIAFEGHKIESRLLSKLLSGSSQIYLMCAAIRKRDVEKISIAMENGQGLIALVFDAYASEYVDGVLSVMMNRKNEMLRRTGQHLTKKRFSAGYGDLDIRYQKIFYDLLDMETMGVKINEQFLLIPEKSVIALAGVE